MQKTKTFVFLFLSLAFFGCNAKKTESVNASMTQEEYMKAKAKEFIDKNVCLQDFYTKGNANSQKFALMAIKYIL